MKIARPQHQKFAGRLAMAESAMTAALRQLQEIFDGFVAVPDEMPSEAALSQARFDGWLDALQAIGNSESMRAHDALRESLLAELAEHAIHSGAPASVESSTPVAAPPPPQEPR